VGHETDYTIADFVADLRAPTPSAAAERVVQAKTDLFAQVESLQRHADAAVRLRLTRTRARVQAVTSHRVFTAERGRIRNHAQRVDELQRRAETGLRRGLERGRDGYRRRRERLEAFRWDRQVAARRERVQRQRDRLHSLFLARVEAGRSALGRLAGKVESLSPLAVLARGYALVWDASGRRLVRAASEVALGDAVRVRLHEGTLAATITGKEPS
jgi:exodeoxyribonuclease VII large subunit